MCVDIFQHFDDCFFKGRDHSLSLPTDDNVTIGV